MLSKKKKKIEGSSLTFGKSLFPSVFTSILYCMEMYENGSKSVIIESSNGYSLSGVQTKKCILISGIILGFPGFENILLEFVSKPHLSPQEKVSIFNKNMEESLSSLKLSDSEHYLKVDSIIFSDIVYQTLKENSFDRFFDIRTVEKDLNDDAGLLFMMCSTFVVLKERDNTENKRSGRVSSSVNDFLRSTSSTQLHQGMDVVVEYSPFVTSSLLNSWSTGIVSQVYGKDSCIFVTDVHLTTQGSTGAPVYRFKNGSKESLLGIIIGPQLWNNSNEWSGNSLAVNLNAVLMHYLDSVNPVFNCHNLSFKNLTERTWFDTIGCSVVRIEVQNFCWGSGVVLNSKLGLIMTCAHVVNFKPCSDVVVKCGTLVSPGKVVYSSKHGEVYDLAVIVTKFSLNSLKQLEISNDFPIQGETVYSAGFNWPNPSKLLVSKGVVSRVVVDKKRKQPVMITSTCCIQPGCSGGALLRSNGQLIGIPVMSLSHSSDSSAHSHYNCAVPLCLFRDLIDEFCLTADISLLNRLTSRESATLSEWRMKNKL